MSARWTPIAARVVKFLTDQTPQIDLGVGDGKGDGTISRYLESKEELPSSPCACAVMLARWMC